jgi:D-hydroxyproline dehydrogenase subunit beta
VTKQSVAVVGAGIVGLAHAWSAAQRGHQVTIFERSPRASGASIRNFGMIWPIGQPAKHRQLALLSRQRWLELKAAAGTWVHECGSIHLAHRADEWAVLQEFEAQRSTLGVDCALLSRDQLLAQSVAANPEGLLGGLYSPMELCINPRQAIAQIAAWLSEQFDARVVFGSEVQSIAENSTGGLLLQTSAGLKESFDRVVICSGIEFQTLFPDVFAMQALKICKLQMLKTAPQPTSWKLGLHLASGLTLRHYQNFEVCPSLTILKQRIRDESPELDRYGIHVMASQNDAGELILGDSHEYDQDIEPFDKVEIDELILRELRKVIRLSDWTIAERWHGLYAKNPSNPYFTAEPLANIHICTATGGAGMTMAFGIAEQAWNSWSA